MVLQLACPSKGRPEYCRCARAPGKAALAGCRGEESVDQQRGEQPGNIEYKVMRLEDGVSFVHVSTADTPDGSNPIPELAAFQLFSRDAAARVATSPVPTAADIIGSYHPVVADPKP
jgi:hypothetical protein